MTDTAHKGLPVAGYAPTQSAYAVEKVNGFKATEERILRELDTMQAMNASLLKSGQPQLFDPRWLAHGRTRLEEAFMFINRSVFQPGRVKLPEDTPQISATGCKSRLT